MDILLNAANAALLVAHDLRREVEVGLLLLGPPDPPRFVRLEGFRLRTRSVSLAHGPRDRDRSKRTRSETTVTHMATAPRRATNEQRLPRRPNAGLRGDIGCAPRLRPPQSLDAFHGRILRRRGP